LIIFYAWQVDKYYIWQRFLPQQILEELIPATVAKGIVAVYIFPGAANTMKMNNVWFTVSNDWCAPQYSKPLTTDRQKDSAIKKNFIDKYHIDMSIYERPDYHNYSSINDWFTRKIRTDMRPISHPSDTSIVVSVADSRVVAFQNVKKDVGVWLKERPFTIRELVGANAYLDSFDNGTMIIFRLAPQDYHRYHSPVSGVVTYQYQINGGLNSVNADAMKSNNKAIYNRRVVTAIDTNTTLGRVIVVAIGATCVGSVRPTVNISQTVVKGQETGYFQFGGSTVAVVFEAGKLLLDDDLSWHSQNAVESLVQQGMRVGKST